MNMRFHAMSGRGARWLGALLGVASALLVAGCAESRAASVDGQSHWLRSCQSSAECGDLECICGVCTTACASDDACHGAWNDAVCSSAALLPQPESCERSAASISVCVAGCKTDADCGHLADGLACGAGVCGPIARVNAGSVDGGADHGAVGLGGGGSSAPPGGGSGGTGAAHVFTGPTLPGVTRLECAGLPSEKWPPGAELVYSFVNAVDLIVDGTTVYGTESSFPNARVWRFSEPAGSVQTLMDLTPEPPGFMAVAGGELVYTDGPGSDDVISKVALSGGDAVPLVSMAMGVQTQALPVQAAALVADGSSIYWLAYGGEVPSNTSAVMRTDHESGETVMVASASGTQPAWKGLLIHRDAIYFGVLLNQVTGADQTQWYRVPKDGSDVARPFGALGGISFMVSDGTDMFAALVTTVDEIGNTKDKGGIARMNLEDGTYEMLFPDPEAMFGLIAVDADNVYWASGAHDETDMNLWRGAKDGSGAPASLAHGWTGMGELALTPTAAYWTIGCDAATHLLRIAK
jgi:hypothetical protein